MLRGALSGNRVREYIQGSRGGGARSAGSGVCVCVRERRERGPCSARRRQGGPAHLNVGCRGVVNTAIVLHCAHAAQDDLGVHANLALKVGLRGARGEGGAEGGPLRSGEGGGRGGGRGGGVREVSREGVAVLWSGEGARSGAGAQRGHAQPRQRPPPWPAAKVLERGVQGSRRAAREIKSCSRREQRNRRESGAASGVQGVAQGCRGRASARRFACPRELFMMQMWRWYYVTHTCTLFLRFLFAPPPLALACLASQNVWIPSADSLGCNCCVLLLECVCSRGCLALREVCRGAT